MIEGLRLSLIEIRSDLDAAIAKLEPTPAITPQTPRLLCFGAKVSSDFRGGVFWIEQQIGLNPDNLMACIAFETGVTFSPSIKNPRSSATGLIQFMRATAIELGTTVEELAKMSAPRQLTYVFKYFQRFSNKHGGRHDLSKWDLADTYMAILLPSMIGKPLDAEMSWGENAHEVNKGLDTDRDGRVTKREAFKKVLAMYELGRMKENLA